MPQNMGKEHVTYHKGGNSSRLGDQQKENRGIMRRIQASSPIAPSSTPVGQIGKTIVEPVHPSGSPMLREKNILLFPTAHGVAPQWLHPGSSHQERHGHP